MATPAKASVGTNVGNLAQDFQTKDQDGNPWKLSDHRGKVVALVFYPKDETSVCTKQMCSMRDRWQDYKDTGAVVAGISIGDSELHKSFADHHSLPQTILADENLDIAKLLKVKFAFGNMSQRAVIVIDKDGIIRYKRSVFPIFRPSDDEVIAAIKSAS